MKLGICSLVLLIFASQAHATEWEDQDGAPDVAIQKVNPKFNVRAGRSTDSEVVGQVGDLVQAGKFEFDLRSDDGDWLKVHTAKGDGWVHRNSLQDVDVKTDFVFRAEPRQGSENLGTIKNRLFINDGDAIFTGRTETETLNGKTNEWHEVSLFGERAWVHKNAINASADEKAAPVVEKTVVAKVKDKAEVIEREPAKETPKKADPTCVGGLSEAQKYERFKKLLQRGNPFTTWNGPFGANIVVGANGQAILNHPMKGKIPLTVTLCMDRKDTPYIMVNGAKIFFKDSNMSQISVKDPTSGDAYDFSRGVQ